jgi:hypothetical protein
MLIGAIIVSVLALLFGLILKSFDHEAGMLARKGIDPASMPDRRVRLLTIRGCIWLFGALASVLWLVALLEALRWRRSILGRRPSVAFGLRRPAGAGGA